MKTTISESTNEETLPNHEITSSARCESSTQSELLLAGEPNGLSAKTDDEVPQEKTIPINLMEEKERLKEAKKKDMSSGKRALYCRLNQQMKIEMTDGRVLVGIFLCTDRDANVILGSCTEFLNPEVCGFMDEPRILGLVMVPGRHIVSIHLDS